MAKLEGIIKFTGAIGDFVAYELNGKWIIRRKSSIPKERIKNDPAFKRTRELNQEFGGASTIGKQLRTFWRPIMQLNKDNTIHHRLNGVLLKMIQQSDGERGQRSFQWNQSMNVFYPFIINKSTHPGRFLTDIPTVNLVSNQLIANFNDIQLINAPKGTTHFKVGTQLNFLQNYHYHPNLGKYLPTNTEQEEHRFESSILSLNESYTAEQIIVPQLTGNWACTVYLLFYQEVNTQFVPLSECPFSWEGIV